MTCTLYNYAGDRRQLNKYLTKIADVNIIEITDSTSILSPTIVLATRELNFNYVYIPPFKRYYYIGNPQVIDGERMAFTLTVDALMSHRAAINTSEVIADRSSSNSNPYIIDRAVQSSDKATVYVRNNGVTPFGVGTGTYILTVGGR